MFDKNCLLKIVKNPDFYLQNPRKCVHKILIFAMNRLTPSLKVRPILCSFPYSLIKTDAKQLFCFSNELKCFDK